MKDKFQNERDISEWKTLFLEADFSWMKQDVQDMREMVMSRSFINHLSLINELTRRDSQSLFVQRPITDAA